MNKLIVFLMISLLIIPVAISVTNYTQLGDDDNFYIRGNGVFNSNLDPQTDVIITPQIFTDPKKSPLINDFDGDGFIEIVILNGITINILQNKTLTTVDTLTLNAVSSERFSNIIIFDIDGDDSEEIILVGEKSGLLHILNFTGGDLQLQNEINASETITHTVDGSGTSVSGLFTIGCSEPNRCLMAYGSTNFLTAGGGVFAAEIYASYFNSTAVANELQLKDGGTAFDTFCPPKIRHMVTANYDPFSDTDIEFIFTYSRPDVASSDSGDDIEIFWVNIESNNSVTLELNTLTTEVGEIFGVESSSVSSMCTNQNTNINYRFTGGIGEALPSKFFSAPLVFDANGGTGGLETIVAMSTDNNEFIMIMYDALGTEVREFPLIQETEGHLISNVFRAEVFDDSTSEQDFCVLGQQSEPQGIFNEAVNILCGSLRDANGFGAFNLQTIEFRSEDTFGLPFNVSDSFDELQILTHAVEFDESNSESEALTSYGVIELDLNRNIFSACFLANECDLNLLFENPREDGVVISSDFDNNNLEDLLVLTSTNLFYIDDGFENQPVSQLDFTTNPCIDSVWKLNTSVEITVAATDPELDLVQVSATLYDGDGNEDSQISANVSSGTFVPFTFTANKSIGAGTLTMTGVDVENPSQVLTETKTFSVANNGVEFNDCTTTGSSSAAVVNDTGLNVSSAATSNEGLGDFFEGAANTFRVSPLIVALILMLGFTLAVLTTPSGEGAGNMMITHNKILMVGLGNLVIFIIAVIAGAISFGILLTILVLGGLIFGFWIKHQVTKSPMQ